MDIFTELYFIIVDYIKEIIRVETEFDGFWSIENIKQIISNDDLDELDDFIQYVSNNYKNDEFDNEEVNLYFQYDYKIYPLITPKKLLLIINKCNKWSMDTYELPLINPTDMTMMDVINAYCYMIFNDGTENAKKIIDDAIEELELGNHTDSDTNSDTE